MKKYSFVLLIASLLLASCGGDNPSSQAPSSVIPSSEPGISSEISSEPSSESLVPSSEEPSSESLTPSSEKPSSESIIPSSEEPSSVLPSSEEPPSSESSSSGSSEEPIPYTDVTVRMTAVLSKPFEATFKYSDTYFDQDSTVFNKDLMMLTLGLNSSSDIKDEMERNFNAIGLTDHLFVDYDVEITVDTFAYGIASKELDNNRLLVFFSPRGMNYYKEWANNFLMGEEGNHQGFYNNALKAYESIKNYIGNYEGKEIVYWITGYSRGGGVANALSNLLLSDEELNIDTANFYAYTFEAPAPLTIDNVKGYQNVFNIINGGDFVPLIPPEEYGLYREGIDIIIDTSDMDVTSIMQQFYEGYYLPEFVVGEGTSPKNEIEFADWIVKQLLKEFEEEDHGIETREKYVNNGQDLAVYVLNLFFSLKKSTIKAIIDDAKAQVEKDMMTFVFSLISTEDGLYEYLNPFIKEDGVEYSEEELKLYCNKLMHLAADLVFAPALTLYVNGTYTNAIRMVLYHFPEVVYNVYLNAEFN